MDIRGYFMHINKEILLKKLIKFINKKYKGENKKRIIWLCKNIIKNNSIENCRRKSPKKKWKGLPKRKSLFHSPKNCGLPVGNYTNQVFANFYLNSMDHFIKHDLKIRYYGRYVDDFILISKNKQKLKKSIPIIRNFLKEKLKLTLHPKKIYFQHYSKGVEFLGALIKPYRKYVSSRIKNNFWELIEEINKKLERGELTTKRKKRILSQINSYLGGLRHCKTYNLREKYLGRLNNDFWDYFEKEKLLKISLRS